MHGTARRVVGSCLCGPLRLLTAVAVIGLTSRRAFLDVPSRVDLMGVLRQLTRSGSLAVIVSTHDLESAYEW